MTPFTNLCGRNQVLKIPIAHNEGNYYIDKAGLESLENNSQVIFRYCSPDGDVSEEFNPNGALANIAGIINKEGNVLGMMPHPERSSEREPRHDASSREELGAGTRLSGWPVDLCLDSPVGRKQSLI